MPTIAEIRQQSGGAYDDMSDSQLADGIYKKFYSDMPRAEFDSKIGVATASAPEKPFLEKLGNFARKVWEDPPSLAKSVSSAVTLPGDVYAGKVDPLSEEGIGRAAELATIATPMAPRGTGGIFARPTAPAGTPLITPRVTPPPTTSEQAVEAAARGGYTLPGYVATEGTVTPQVASSLKNVPWGGQPIVRSHDELLANMGRAAEEIAPEALTADLAGERGKTGIKSWIKTRSQQPLERAYEAVDARVDPNVRLPLDNTAKMVADIMGERAQARIPGQSEAVKRVLTAVQDPTGMDYAGAKGLRTWLGEITPQEMVAQGIKPLEAKRLYGAMSEDLSKIVLRAGGDRAVSAWRAANRLTVLTKAQQNALAKIVGERGDAAPEAVFNQLLTFANSKRGADLNRLKLAKQVMGPSAWGEIGSTAIDRLGKAPDGTFSPQRFVTAWGNMAPAAKGQLFSGQQYAALTDLFTVSKHIQDRITRFGNPSGTARGSIIGQAITGGALFAEPISTLTTLVGARLAAEALSRPALVRAATAVSRASLARNPVAIRRAVALLRAVAVREGLISAAEPQQQQGR